MVVLNLVLQLVLGPLLACTLSLPSKIKFPTALSLLAPIMQVANPDNRLMHISTRFDLIAGQTLRKPAFRLIPRSHHNYIQSRMRVR